MSDKQVDNMAIIGDNRTSKHINGENNVKEDSEERASSASATRPNLENAPKTKKSGFKIISVTKGVAAQDINTDGDGDSIDDILDGSHTEEVNSEVFDTSKKTDCDHDSTPEDTIHNLTPDDTVREKHSDAGGPSRFKVVKIESTEPFKRGRWACHDFLDPTADKDKADVIKPAEESHSGNSSGSNSVNYVQGVDDPSKNPLLVNSQVLTQVVSNTIATPQNSEASVRGHISIINPSVGAPHSVINAATDFIPIQTSSQKPTASQITDTASATSAHSTTRTETPTNIVHGSTPPSGQVPATISQSLSSQIQPNATHTALPNSTQSQQIIVNNTNLPPIKQPSLASQVTNQQNTTHNQQSTQQNTNQQIPTQQITNQQITNQRNDRNPTSSHSAPNTAIKNSAYVQPIPVTKVTVIQQSGTSMQTNVPSYPPQPIQSQHIGEHPATVNTQQHPVPASNTVQTNTTDQISSNTISNRSNTPSSSVIPVHPVQSTETNTDSIQSVKTSQTPAHTNLVYSDKTPVNHVGDSTDIGNGDGRDSVRQETKQTIEKPDSSMTLTIPSESSTKDMRPSQLGVGGAGLLTPLAAAVGGLTAARDDQDDSGASTVTIDNRIEQAMDLVKSHLKFAVREEVEVLREQIVDLVKKNTQLEQENNILKAGASQETLAKLTNQSRPSAPPSSSS